MTQIRRKKQRYDRAARALHDHARAWRPSRAAHGSRGRVWGAPPGVPYGSTEGPITRRSGAFGQLPPHPTENDRLGGENEERAHRKCSGPSREIPATSYSPTPNRRSTIGAEGFHFRVRDGNGWVTFAIATENWDSPGAGHRGARSSAAPEGPRTIKNCRYVQSARVVVARH